MSQLWTELHQRALSYKGTDDSVFLRIWAAKLPRFTTGCACKEFWRAWSILNKPIYEPEGAYFAWTVKAHNAVNQKLGKQTYTVEQALAEWANNDKSIPQQNLKDLNAFLKEPPFKRTIQKTLYPPKPDARLTRPLHELGHIKEGIKEKDVLEAKKKNEELTKQYKANNTTTQNRFRQTSNINYSSLKPMPLIQKNLWLPIKNKK